MTESVPIAQLVPYACYHVAGYVFTEAGGIRPRQFYGRFRRMVDVEGDTCAVFAVGLHDVLLVADWPATIRLAGPARQPASAPVDAPRVSVDVFA